MTQDEAKKVLLEEVQKELTGEIAKKIRQAEEKIKEEAHDKGMEILLDAMKHGATSLYCRIHSFFCYSSK